VTGLDVLHTDDGEDVAGLGLLDLVAVVGVHLNHTADTRSVLPVAEFRIVSPRFS
jgi:hypothetical protein